MNVQTNRRPVVAEETTWKHVVMWHGVAMLPRLRKMTSEQRLQVMNEANEHNMANPLHYCPREQFVVKSWSERKLTGPQVTALLVFGLWVQAGENEEMAPGLVSDWPVKAASLLAQRS